MMGEDEARMHRAVDQATKMQGEEPREVEQRRRHEARAEAATELWREMTPRGGYDLHKQHSMEAYFEERAMADTLTASGVKDEPTPTRMYSAPGGGMTARHRPGTGPASVEAESSRARRKIHPDTVRSDPEWLKSTQQLTAAERAKYRLLDQRQAGRQMRLNRRPHKASSRYKRKLPASPRYELRAWHVQIVVLGASSCLTISEPLVLCCLRIVRRPHP